MNEDEKSMFVEFDAEDSFVITGGKMGMGLSRDGSTYAAIILETIKPLTLDTQKLVLLVPPMIKDDFLRMLESVKHT